jgi:hypothetical protein
MLLVDTPARNNDSFNANNAPNQIKSKQTLKNVHKILHVFILFID